MARTEFLPCANYIRPPSQPQRFVPANPHQNQPTAMRLRIPFAYIVTFMALTFVMHEAHEIVHTSIGRAICGCWGKRDFNVWALCTSCENNPYGVIATLAGPVFTFAMIWYGSTFLNSTNTNNQKAFGFSLIFANMPFARLFNPIFGGGDEVVVVNTFLQNHDASRIIVLILLILIVAYPLYKAYKIIENKYKIGWFILFFLMPMVLDLLIVLGVMNTLLDKGVLSNYWILGSPMLVTVWTAAVLMIYLLSRKNIHKLAKG